jgi:hypothetical protein
MFSETRKALEDIFNKAEDTLVVNEYAGLDKKAILKNLKIKYDAAHFSQSDFYDTTNQKEDTIAMKEFFNPTHRKLRMTNPNFIRFTGNGKEGRASVSNVK